MSDKIYWLNKDSQKFLERGYLLEGETPEQRISDIAHRAQELLDDMPGFSDKFVGYMERGFYSLSSPIWSNFGRKRGLPISCFGSYIPDDMHGILSKVGEVGTMSKVGGGTSAYFGDVRGRGAPISSGGHSTGVHHQLTVFDSIVNYVAQGNVRRGSFAAYLPIDHPDIEEFLKIRSEGNAIQDLSIGVCVSDEWMKSMIEGDRDKRKIWSAVIKKRFESGYPYIFFSDNANNGAPQMYKDRGLKIHASNLCLVGDTQITISESISGKNSYQISLQAFDEMWQLGRFLSGVYVKTADSSGTPCWAKISNSALTAHVDELICIETENGNVIECTSDHQIFTSNRGWVKAGELTEDDCIVECN